MSHETLFIWTFGSEGKAEDMMEGRVTQLCIWDWREGPWPRRPESSDCSMGGRRWMRAELSGTCQNRWVFGISLGGKGHRLTGWFISKCNSLSRSKAFTFYGLQSIKTYRASVCFQMGEYSFWSLSHSICRKQIYCTDGDDCVLVCVTVGGRETRSFSPAPTWGNPSRFAGGLQTQVTGNWTTPCLQSVFHGSYLISLLSRSILRCLNHVPTTCPRWTHCIFSGYKF